MSTINNCEIGHYITLYENVIIGESILGDFSYISSSTKIVNAHIGKFCSIGPDCLIGLGKHPSSHYVSTHPIFFSTSSPAQVSFSDKTYFVGHEKITIGNDVWIGARAIVLDGVIIGDGAIIAAGAVVTKNVPAYAVVGGIPAKVLKFRFSEKHIEFLLSVKWWDRDIHWLKDHHKLFLTINDFESYLAKELQDFPKGSDHR